MGKILSLVGDFGGFLIKMPFHQECLKRSRGNRMLRKRIRSTIRMICQKPNGGNECDRQNRHEEDDIHSEGVG